MPPFAAEWCLKRRKSSQSAVARWTSCSDSPCEAQTPPPPTNPGRPPRSRHTDASAESWCAALHQGVPCAQRQDVVVAHQPGGGDYLRINSLRRVERKCRQLECMLERCMRRAARGARECMRECRLPSSPVLRACCCCCCSYTSTVCAAHPAKYAVSCTVAAVDPLLVHISSEEYRYDRRARANTITRAIN